MKLTMEQLNELMGFNITDDAFFSEGTVILFDGAWRLVAVCGSDLIFKLDNDLRTAQENTDFFYDRAQGRNDDDN